MIIIAFLFIILFFNYFSSLSLQSFKLTQIKMLWALTIFQHVFSLVFEFYLIFIPSEIDFSNSLYSHTELQIKGYCVLYFGD